MPKTWSQVVESDEYKGMSIPDRRAARDQYFLEVVAPKAEANNFDIDSVYRDFLGDTESRSYLQKSDGWGEVALAGAKSAPGAVIQSAGGVMQSFADAIPEAEADMQRIQTQRDKSSGLLDYVVSGFNPSNIIEDYSNIPGKLSGAIGKAYDYVTGSSIASDAESTKKYGEDWQKEAAPYIDPADWGKRAAFDVSQNLAMNAAPLAASIVTGGAAPALGAFGAMEYGSSYQEQREGGQKPDDARMWAALSGAAEIIPEKFSLDVLLKPGSSLLRRTLGSIGMEGATEAVTSVLQDWIRQNTISPDMTLKDIVKNAGYAGALGGISGGIMSPIGHAGDMWRQSRKPAEEDKADASGRTYAGKTIDENLAEDAAWANGGDGTVRWENPDLGGTGQPIYSPTEIIPPERRLPAPQRRLPAPRQSDTLFVDSQGAISGMSETDAFNRQVAGQQYEQQMSDLGYTPDVRNAATMRQDLEDIINGNKPVEEVLRRNLAPSPNQTPIAAKPKLPKALLVEQASQQTAGSPANNIPSPSEAQKKAGNYQKGHVSVHGMPVTIETPKGGERSGISPDGKAWKVTMPYDYGYIKGTKAADGDNLDAYIGSNPESKKVFVVEQKDLTTNKFDEHKTFVGFDSLADALKAYSDSFSDGKAEERIMNVQSMDVDSFKRWANSPAARKPMSAKTKSIENDISKYEGQDTDKLVSRLEELSTAKDKGSKYERVLISEVLKDREAATLQEPEGYKPPTSEADYYKNPVTLGDVIQYDQEEQELAQMVQDALRTVQDYRRTKAPPKPKRLSDFIKDNGGMRDSGGELAQMEIRRPGIVNNAKGRDMDMMREAAAEAGYLPMDSTVSDFIDMLNEDLRGNKQYTEEYRYDDTPFYQEQYDQASQFLDERGYDSRQINKDARRKEASDRMKARIAKQMEYQPKFDNNDGGVRVKDKATGETRLIGEYGFREETGDFYFGSYLHEVFGDKQIENADFGKIKNQVRKMWEENKDNASYIFLPREQREAAKAAMKAERESARVPEMAAQSKTGAVVEKTDQGMQSVIPGAEKINDRKLAERQMDKPKRSAVEQKPADSGLFDVSGRSQEDMFTSKQAQVNQPKIEPEDTPVITTVSAVENIIKDFDSGKLSSEEVLSSFESVVSNKDAIIDDLNKLTIQKLKQKIGFSRGGKKSDIVNQVYSDMLMDFAIDPVSYMIGGKNAFENAIREQVKSYTPEKIAAYAENNQKKREAALENKRKYEQSLNDPKTVDDYRNIIREKGRESLTQEQQITYDRLIAEQTVAKQTEEKRRKQDQKAESKKVDGVSFKTAETKHTRDGHDLYVATITERVEREVFNTLLSRAKSFGGSYSSYSRGGAIPGFQFRTEEARNNFMNMESTADTSGLGKTDQEIADALLSKADAIQEKAEEKLNQDRLTNTHKRATQAAHAEADANAEIALAKTMKNIANGIADGSIKFLRNIRHKTEVEQLHQLVKMAVYETDRDLPYSEQLKRKGRPATEDDVKNIEVPYPYAYKENLEDLIKQVESKSGYKMAATTIKRYMKDSKHPHVVYFKHSYAIDALEKIVNYIISKSGSNTYTAQNIRESIADYRRFQRLGFESVPHYRAAMREFIELTAQTKKLDPVKEAERALIGQKIDGYFPTPQKVIDRITDIAGIDKGHTILEPSAGKGNIADAIRAHYPDNQLSVIEVVPTLRNILEMKGHHIVGRDFMEHDQTYDRIVMNPPFENGQDIDHVRHAYDLLEPGGRLVAVVSEGPFYRSDKKATDFRKWLDEVGGENEKLPEGAFKESERSTGVNTRLVAIDKPLGRDSKLQRGEKGDERVYLEPLYELSEKKQAVIEKLEAQAKEVFGDKVQVRFLGKMKSDGKEIFGAMQPRAAQDGIDHLIYVSLSENNKSPEVTFNHETVHILRRMGALDDVWPLLEKTAKDDWIKRHNIKELYGAEKEEMQIEEAIAEAYGQYISGTRFHYRINRAFARIREFLRKIASYFGKEFGTRDWRDIFTEISSIRNAQEDIVALDDDPLMMFQKLNKEEKNIFNEMDESWKGWAQSYVEGFKELRQYNKDKPYSRLRVLGKIIARSDDHRLGFYAKTFGSKAINEIREMFYHVPGDDRAVAQTYEEAVQEKGMTLLNEFGSITENYTGRELQEAVKYIQNPDTIKAASNKIGRLATDISRFLKKHRDYLAANGINIDDSEGYFPRKYLLDKIVDNVDDFLDKATLAYLDTYRDDFIKEASGKLKSSGEIVKDKDAWIEKTITDSARRKAEEWLSNIKLRELGISPDNNTLFIPSAGVPKPDHFKPRQLSKNADNILREYLEQNPNQVIPHMIMRSIKKVEFDKRFGGDKWEKLSKRMREDGVTSEAVDDIKKIVLYATGSMRTMGTTGRNITNWIRTLTYTMFMSHSTLTSLTEPLVAGMRTRSVLNSVRSMGYTMQALKKSEGVEAARRISDELLGLTGEIAEDIMMQHRSDGQLESDLIRKANIKFFRRIGLTAWTNATRVSAVKIGMYYVPKLVERYRNPKTRKSAEYELRELGIPDARMDDFADYIENNGFNYDSLSGDDGAKGLTSMAQYSRVALRRFAEGIIMNPKPVERQLYAKHPLINILYQLQAYIMSFSKSVLIRDLKMGKESIWGDGYSAQDRWAMFPSILSYSLLIAMSAALSYLRDDVILEKPDMKEKDFKDHVLTGISRSGLYGGFDPWFNLFTSLKYQRDPATVMVGPFFGRSSELFASTVKYFSNNSENTNSAERKLAKDVYLTLMLPSLNLIGASMPNNPIGKAVGPAFIQFASHPKTVDAFVTKVAGEPNPPRKKRND